MDDIPKLPEVRKLPPNPERLKNLVSRDFSKPPPSPNSRPDPRQQQLVKPVSDAKKPPDIFKQQKVRLDKTMNNMVSMTNYGEAEKPDPYKSKLRQPKEEEQETQKKPQSYQLPKELKRALGGQKLPPITKPKAPPPSPSPSPLLDPSPTLPPPHPTPLPQIPQLMEEPELSFVFAKDDKSEEDDVAVTDSAYCTCEDYTESEDYQSLLTEDGTHSSAHRLEICSNCGGKRSFWGSRVPSSIKEQSFVILSRSSSGIFTEEPQSPSPPPAESPQQENPTLSTEDVLLDILAESPPPLTDKKPRIDFLKALDEIGQFHGIPDPEPELPPPEPTSRTVLAPIKRQKGVYANGVREAYIKALVAAEVSRLPQEWQMMLGPRISRSWVFSYFDYVPPKDPNYVPPPPPTPPPSYLTGTAPEPKKKKKKKKKFKPMKHIFGKVKPDSYFPGMKKNQVLAPVTITTDSMYMNQAPPAPYKQVLDPLEENTFVGEKNGKRQTVDTPVKDYRLTRNVSRQSSHHSHSHDTRL